MHYPATVAGWAYFIGAVILLTVGGWVQNMDFKAGMLITEYGLVLLPVLLIGWFLKINMKSALRLKPLKSREVILIPVTVAFSLPITLFLNLLVITIMAQFGKAYAMPIPSAENLSDLSMLFFIISISAGICEEFFFRGMMLDAYTARFDAKKGIIISAVLFGLFHFNPQNLLGPIFLGLLFGYLVLITKSILAGVLAHMTNNGIAVMVMYGANQAQNGALTQGSSANMLNDNPEQMMMALLVLGIIALGCTSAVLSLLRIISKGRKISDTDELPMVQTGIEDELIHVRHIETDSKSLRLAEVIPLAIPIALYTAISYYLIAIKH